MRQPLCLIADYSIWNKKSASLLMGLSSDTLIQQTTFKNLLAILKESAFRTSYCEETFDHGTPKYPLKTYQHVFPMISFSEIPITSLHKHLYRYGDCIIGIKKEWAIKNGLNQVQYCQRASNLTLSLFETYHYFYGKVGGQLIENTPLYQAHLKAFEHLEYQVAFTKNYSGEVSSARYKDDNYVFAEEKEWRYVPKNEHRNRPLSLEPDKFRENKKKYQSEIGSKKLSFDVKDISYLVTETEEQKMAIRDFLLKKEHDVHVNIFTNEEIYQNFLGYKNPSIKEYDLTNEIEQLKKKLTDSKSPKFKDKSSKN